MLQPGWEWDWGELMHIYIWLTLCCSPETITALLIRYTPIQNKMLQNNNNNTARKKKKPYKTTTKTPPKKKKTPYRKKADL